MSKPGYWMHETSGKLRPAVSAYLNGGSQMTPDHIAAMREYLRQWADGDWWPSPALTGLRNDVDGLQSEEDIRRWIRAADRLGIDPL